MKAHKIKRMYRKVNKKVIKPCFLSFVNHRKTITYISLFLFGLGLMSLTFWIPDKWDNAINVICGIGSGIFTSMIVTAIINEENRAREKRKIQQEKEFLFNNIIVSSLDVYGDIIDRINEYITLTELDLDNVYGLYIDFEPFNDFAKHLKTLDINKLTEKQSKNLEKLFNFRNYRIDYLISEIKHLPRQEYFLRGLLSQEEYRNLFNNVANDAYLSFVDHINEFWDNEILDLPKCIKFLRMTIYITSQTISTFDYAINKAKAIEKDIKYNIDQLYFHEVYSMKEEYVMAQLEGEIDKWNYYAEHPEELEELENLYNLTEEDLAIRELTGCLYGFSENSVENILNKLDKNSEKVKDFFNKKDVRIALKKKRKIMSIIKTKYGKNYLKEISQSEGKNNGQA